MFERYYRSDRMEEISKAELRGRLLLIYRMVKADTMISYHPESLVAQTADQLVTGEGGGGCGDVVRGRHGTRGTS